MVDETESSCPWEQVETLLAAGDAGQLSGYLKEIPGGEVARCFSRLSSENVQQVLTLLDGKDAADIVEQLPESFSADILSEMEGSVAAQVLEQMPSNERADVLSEMDRDEAAAILEEMKPAAAAEAMALSLYPPEVAGGLMITEYLRHYEDVTVDDVVGDFRQHAEQYSDYDVQYTYIVTREEVLVGVLRLRDLLLAPRRKTIAEIMIRQPLQVSAGTPLTTLGDFFEEHPLMGVPVTDDRGRLVGVVRREDVDEALLERSDRDYLKSQGIVSGEELRSMSVWRLATHDALTGVLGRREIFEMLSRGKALSDRAGTPFSLCMLDLDNFKQMNDTYGHQAGDAVLSAFAGVLKNNTRATDYVGRYGGEEFLVVFSNFQCLDNGSGGTQRLLAATRALRFPDISPDLKITTSIGIATYQPGESPDALIARADAALYEAKKKGKDQAVFKGPEPPPRHSGESRNPE